LSGGGGLSGGGATASPAATQSHRSEFPGSSAPEGPVYGSSAEGRNVPSWAWF